MSSPSRAILKEVTGWAINGIVADCDFHIVGGSCKPCGVANGDFLATTRNGTCHEGQSHHEGGEGSGDSFQLTLFLNCQSVGLTFQD